MGILDLFAKMKRYFSCLLDQGVDSRVGHHYIFCLERCSSDRGAEHIFVSFKLDIFLITSVIQGETESHVAGGTGDSGCP